MEHVQTTGSQRNINVAKKQQILRSRNVEILPTWIVFANILIYIDINYILKIFHVLHKTGSVFIQPQIHSQTTLNTRGVLAGKLCLA